MSREMEKGREYAGISDEKLLSRMRAGEPAIMDYLIDKYKPLVRTKARVLYLVGGDQDDLIQEGMIGLFKAIRDYRADKNARFSTFAILCIDRQLYRVIESSNRQKHIPLNTSISIDSEEGESQMRFLEQEGPEALVLDQEYAEWMEETIRERLSPLEYRVLKDYLDGKNYREIAAALGREPKAIDNALQRVRKKIRGIVT